MTQPEVAGETLTLIIADRCEMQLGDRTWRRAMLPGYLTDEPKGKPDLAVPATLIDPDIEPGHQEICQLGLDPQDRIQLTISGWNLIRCATWAETTFDDIEAISGQDWDRIERLGLKTVKMIGLNYLCQWIAVNNEYKSIQDRDAAMRNAIY